MRGQSWTTMSGRSAGPATARAGFTLIELLVVIVIIVPGECRGVAGRLAGLSHRQVSEAARIVQASLAGARDSALHTEPPAESGCCPTRRFRWFILRMVRSTRPSRWLQTASSPSNRRPNTPKARLSVVMPDALDTTTNAYSLSIPYPQSNGGGYYP